MKFYIKRFWFLPFLVLGLWSCEEDELAFDVVASPVLGLFETIDDSASDMIQVKATFLELDKTNILDHTKGIDSIPVSNLAIKVYVLDDQLLGEYTTDSDGAILFEKERTALLGSSRLEFAGNHKEIDFRIFKNL